jgi:hypothetical protein
MTLICCSVVPLWTKDMLDVEVFKMRAGTLWIPCHRLNRTIPSLYPPSRYCTMLLRLQEILALKSGLQNKPSSFQFRFIPTVHFSFFGWLSGKILNSPEGKLFYCSFYGLSRYQLTKPAGNSEIFDNNFFFFFVKEKFQEQILVYIPLLY